MRMTAQEIRLHELQNALDSDSLADLTRRGLFTLAAIADTNRITGTSQENITKILISR
jgi:hypothetical protein